MFKEAAVLKPTGPTQMRPGEAGRLIELFLYTPERVAKIKTCLPPRSVGAGQAGRRQSPLASPGEGLDGSPHRGDACPSLVSLGQRAGRGGAFAFSRDGPSTARRK